VQHTCLEPESRRAVAAVLWTAVLALAASGQSRGEENYPQFLYDRVAHVAPSANLPEEWSSTLNVAWKTDIPGLAWASPVVWGDKVFLNTAVTEGKEKGAKKGLYLEDLDASRYGKPTNEYRWQVICLDLNTGTPRWTTTVHKGVPPKNHHKKNTLASETPVTDGERVYAYFGNVGLFCLDMEGKQLWKYEVPITNNRFSWGTSISPILYEDTLYLVNDNDDRSYLAAIDKRTGKEKWRVDRDEKANYCTPYIWKNDKRTELVVSGIGKVRSYSLDGQLLWELGGMCGLAIPTPFAHDGLLYVTSGHVIMRPRPIYAIRPGASGNISLSDKADSNESIAWARKMDGPYHPTPLVLGDYLYVLYDTGMINAYHKKTGEPLSPKRFRIPEGRAFTSSPWTHGGKIFCLNEDGVTFVLKPGPSFEIVRRNALKEDDMCMASPAILKDRLLIRTAKRVYCIAKQRVQ
jgi:outer membrane protein assembly factor BamB